MAFYIALYSYLLSVGLLVCFVTLFSGKHAALQVADLLVTNRHPLWRGAYVTLVLVLLGTPPTLGFLYKLVLFEAFAQTGVACVLSALIINLILMVLYLQLARVGAHPRKRRLLSHTATLQAQPVTAFLVLLVVSAAAPQVLSALFETLCNLL